MILVLVWSLQRHLIPIEHERIALNESTHLSNLCAFINIHGICISRTLLLTRRSLGSLGPSVFCLEKLVFSSVPFLPSLCGLNYGLFAAQVHASCSNTARQVRRFDRLKACFPSGMTLPPWLSKMGRIGEFNGHRRSLA